MGLIKIDTKEYPVSTTEFKERFPRVSFPDPLPVEDFGYATVNETARPSITRRQEAKELDPELIGGKYYQVWAVIDKILTPGEDAAITAAEAQEAAALAAKQELVAEAIIKLSYAELEKYIDDNVTDLASARAFLEKLARVVKALVERAF